MLKIQEKIIYVKFRSPLVKILATALVWKMRPPLRSREKVKYPHKLLVLGWWNIVSFEPCCSTVNKAITKKINLWEVPQINMTAIKWPGNIWAVHLPHFFDFFFILSSRKIYSKPLLFMCICASKSHVVTASDGRQAASVSRRRGDTVFRRIQVTCGWFY